MVTIAVKRKNIFRIFVKRMKFFTKIILFLVLFSGCASSRPRTGKSPEEVHRINNRRELKSSQDARRKRAEDAKAMAEKRQKKLEDLMPEVTKQKEIEEKRAAKAQKEGKKRHLKWQSKEAKKRMKKSKKEAEKRMKN
jgi:type IV secretory pathway VirB10-like protein